MKYLLLVLIFLLATPLFAEVTVYVAPLLLQGENSEKLENERKPEEQLIRFFSEQDYGRAVTLLSTATELDQPPKSFLEAARAAELFGYSYLLYGFVKSDSVSYQAELKLFDSDSKSIVATFFVSDSLDKPERLMKTLTSRITDYFYQDIGLEPVVEEEPERNILLFPISLGYWTNVLDQWDQLVAGLGALQGGVRFIPVDPMFSVFDFPSHLRFGLSVDYNIGMNEPNYESFVLHTLKFRIPAEAIFQFDSYHSLGIGTGPMLQMDILVQDRKYTSGYMNSTAVFGGFASLFYRYTLSESLTLGIENYFDIAAYEQLQTVYSPRIFIELSMGPLQGGTE